MEEITTTEGKTNAERFIAAYNRLDYNLRSIYDLKRSMSFSDVIRRSVVLNSIVRKYEDDLIDFGRLRNAIVHQGNKDYIIAEPHDEVVEKLERLEELISEPPKAIDTVGNKEIITLDGTLPLGKAIELIYRTGYGNLPVTTDGAVVGIINGRKLINLIGKKISEGENIQSFLDNTTVGEVIESMEDDYYFIIADENLTVEGAMNFFETNRKLAVVLITKGAKNNSKLLKIITSADIIDMKRILDIY